MIDCIAEARRTAEAAQTAEYLRERAAGLADGGPANPLEDSRYGLERIAFENLAAALDRGERPAQTEAVIRVYGDAGNSRVKVLSYALVSVDGPKEAKQAAQDAIRSTHGATYAAYILPAWWNQNERTGRVGRAY